MVMIDSGISKVLQAADQCMINRYSHQLNVSDQFFFTKNWFSSACGCKRPSMCLVIIYS